MQRVERSKMNGNPGFESNKKKQQANTEQGHGQFGDLRTNVDPLERLLDDDKHVELGRTKPLRKLGDVRREQERSMNQSVAVAINGKHKSEVQEAIRKDQPVPNNGFVWNQQLQQKNKELFDEEQQNGSLSSIPSSSLASRRMSTNNQEQGDVGLDDNKNDKSIADDVEQLAEFDQDLVIEGI